MASPDVSSYIDLTLFDKQPQEVYDEAIEYAQISLPEFEPKTGSIEATMLQAAAQMTGELAGAINRMTPGMVEVLLQLFDVTRESGTPATGTVEITTIDNSGYTIPTGTRFGYVDRSDPENPFLFALDTTEDLVISPGNSTGVVDVSAVFQRTYPSLLAGQTLQLISPVSFILSAELDENLVVGTDAETDAEFFSRAIAKLNSYSAALALPSQFTQYVLATFSDVHRAVTYSRVAPGDENISGWTPDNGYVMVYVSKVGGASLTAGAKTAIEEALAEKAVAGLDINVKDAIVDSVDVSVTVKLQSGYASADVKDAVELALDQYLHPDYWTWGEKIYYNEVVSLIDQVPGVDRVVSLSLDGGGTGVDYSFVRYGTLPLNVPTVTVSI